MKNINESFSNIRSLRDSIKGEQIDEGLRDILKIVKDKFKRAWTYLKGVVTKLGSYFLKVDDNGEIIPAITPLTTGEAVREGNIDNRTTTVVLDKEGQKITGLRTSYNDVLKRYGKDDCISYWLEMVNESMDDEGNMINEVKLEHEDPEAGWNVIVDDAELKEEIEYAIESGDSQLMIWGAPGIGKTAILKNVLNEMKEKFPDYSLITKTLSNETPDNFFLPKYVETERGEFAEDVPKTWLPVYKPSSDPVENQKRDEACGNGLLFLDELSRTPKQVTDVILPLINEKEFNGWKVGSGWSIICASNRPEDDRQTALSKALLNRFSHIYYNPTCKSWTKWAQTQGYMSPLLLQWLNLPTDGDGGVGGSKYYYWDPNDEMDDKETGIFCTPRQWTNVMKELATREKTCRMEGFGILDVPEAKLGRIFNKRIPKTAVSAFINFLNIIRGVGDFDKFIDEIWSKGTSKAVNKEDMQKINIALTQLICVSHAKELPTGEEFANVCKWIAKQDSSSIASYFMDVFYNTFVPEGADVEWVMNWHRITDKQKKILKDTKIKKFCEKWHISSEDMPDYTAGIKTLVTKYGEDFAAAVIDGKEGLG